MKRVTFHSSLILLCLAYLTFEFYLIPHLRLAADESWFASHIYHYTYQLPYRDFPPYKTILGYYLYSVPFFFSHDILTPLFYIKKEIAVLNTLFLGTTAWMLSRIFKPAAVLFTLAMLLSSHFFLIYSVDLRVDMLTAWLGLFAFILALRERISLGGLILAASFLVSQKALWFFLAINAALGMYWLFAARDKQRFLQWVVFNLFTLIPIALYLIVWSVITNSHDVLNSVFYESFSVAKMTIFATLWYPGWQTALWNSPLLFLLWPITWLSLFTTPAVTDTTQRVRWLTAIFANIILLLVIQYQQPFSYNLVYAVPALLLLYSDFFSWLMDYFQQKTQITLKPRAWFWLTALICIGLYGIMLMFGLPPTYLIITFIPVMLWYIPKMPQSILPILLGFILVGVGIFYPLSNIKPMLAQTDNGYQTRMIRLAHSLLNNQETYVAGIPFLYSTMQPIAGMKNLITPALQYLHTPDKALEYMLMTSLYMEPRTEQQVCADFEKTPVKLIINNYRIAALPQTIQTYLDNHYLHFWGSIYLYAPVIAKNTTTFSLLFSGKYTVLAPQGSRVNIDSKSFTTGTVIYLNTGIHHSKTKMDYRLKLLPEKNDLNLLEKDREDRWLEMVRYVLN